MSVALSPTEAEFAYVLAREVPRAVAYDQLICALWGDNEGEASYSHLKVLAGHTRGKVAILGLTIETIRFVGYRLVRSDRTIFRLASRIKRAANG